MEYERAAVAQAAQLEHLAQHQPVVPGLVALVDPAVDPGGDAVEQRGAGRRRRRPGDAGELVSAGGGEPAWRAPPAPRPGRWRRTYRPPRSPASSLRSSRAQTATSGGSSETDMNEPTTRPLGCSGSPPVTTTTPVGRRPSTERKLSECGLVSSEGSDIIELPQATPSAHPHQQRRVVRGLEALAEVAVDPACHEPGGQLARRPAPDRSASRGSCGSCRHGNPTR